MYFIIENKIKLELAGVQVAPHYKNNRKMPQLLLNIPDFPRHQYRRL